MPLSNLPPEILEKGFWGLLGVLITVGTTTLLGWMKLRSAEKISKDGNWLKGQVAISEREDRFISHLETEMSRLNAQMADLHDAYLRASKALDDEKESCQQKIAALQQEIDELKRRMFNEESR